MTDKITQLAQEASVLEMDAEDRKKLQNQVLSYSERFFNSLLTDDAYKPFNSSLHSLLEEPITEAGEPAGHLIRDVEHSIMEPGLNVPSGRNFGYIPGSSLASAAIGDYLAAVTNRYASVYTSSPGAVLVEIRLIRWLADLVGYDKHAGGYLASGGSIANLTAVVTARDSAGLTAADFPKAVVYLTGQTHHCVDRALNIAGLSQCRRHYVEMDNGFRMRPEKLREFILDDKKKGLIPLMIVASAGSTDTGAIDPMEEIGEIAREHNIWFHVDAAYGGFFALTEDGKQKLKGIEKSDSVVLDPHKSLFLPYGIGALIVKDKQSLADSHRYAANYMQDSLANRPFYSPADVSPELSKHFRALRMWLPLKLHGVKAFRSALEEKMLLTRYLWEQFREMDEIETGPPPQLSIFMFRWVPKTGDANEMNRKLHQNLLQAGRVFLSTTVVEGTFYLRVAVLSVRTHLEEANKLLDEIKQQISELNKLS
jgi:aromatic-L-amino-acid/L-tryptophan decarboxylase